MLRVVEGADLSKSNPQQRSVSDPRRQQQRMHDSRASMRQVQRTRTCRARYQRYASLPVWTADCRLASAPVHCSPGAFVARHPSHTITYRPRISVSRAAWMECAVVWWCARCGCTQERRRGKRASGWHCGPWLPSTPLLMLPCSSTGCNVVGQGDGLLFLQVHSFGQSTHSISHVAAALRRSGGFRSRR